MTITPIADTNSLAAFCEKQKTAAFVTVDTEFVREKTYYPILCLVQLAGPDDAVVIDAMASDIDLSPLDELFKNTNVVKVLHASRQDNEIFFNLFGSVPKPIFDTQIAAMVCGFGDQVAYGTLIAKLVGVQLEKTSRFADWSRRPLTQKQLAYALSDVTHLRVAYEKLAAELETSGRTHWLDSEMDVLTDPDTYRMDPREAWRRIKSRTTNPKFLSVLREVAAWREAEAQRRDIPRNRLLRDDSLLDIAAHTPKTSQALSRTRGMPRGFAEGRMADGLLDAIETGVATKPEDQPRVPKRDRLPNGLGPLTDLLKTLLKLRCEEEKVAPKLIASADDLERIAASDNADVPALSGWRREVFGEQALALKQGKLGLTAEGKRIRIMEIGDGQ
ncbi:MAG: ribonuclease D [Pseudomonadota bacterium]|nr:ribonuclease D [Pseudomonadota bacterium]